MTTTSPADSSAVSGARGHRLRRTLSAAVVLSLSVVALLVTKRGSWWSSADAATPSLAQVLARHAFLVHDAERGRLLVPRGRHELVDDLVAPTDMVLFVEPGARLLVAPGKAIVASALAASGTREDPIEFGALDATAGWIGLLLLGGAGDSRMEHVAMRDTTGSDRGPWRCSAGLTVCTPIALSDCEFSGARCEDAVNLTGQRFRMRRCRFERTRSDMFDGDFVAGEVIECTFVDAGGDAVDLSGSEVELRGCSFASIGDKAVSAGERSIVRVVDCRIERAALGVVAKDRSAVAATGLTVAHIAHFVFAAYQKKADYGPARIDATGLQLMLGQASLHLVQTDSAILIDGEPVPSRPVDIAELYRQKVLGK